ncbi:hypothetical protein L596_000418 [Steinernema carpocapsae]|uniref:Uncharacterized protein n=1 Tax=Steinernema carpocapsae TaxID=34508 RepID=A0A4U8UJH2_STECR|nr:hypothetical protein L596_000418 [Steinernema carpocapsae]
MTLSNSNIFTLAAFTERNAPEMEEQHTLVEVRNGPIRGVDQAKHKALKNFFYAMCGFVLFVSVLTFITVRNIAWHEHTALEDAKINATNASRYHHLLTVAELDLIITKKDRLKFQACGQAMKDIIDEVCTLDGIKWSYPCYEDNPYLGPLNNDNHMRAVHICCHKSCSRAQIKLNFCCAHQKCFKECYGALEHFDVEGILAGEDIEQ